MPVVPSQRAPPTILSNCTLFASSPASVCVVSMSDQENSVVRKHTLLLELHRQFINLSLELRPFRELILGARRSELSAQRNKVRLLPLLLLKRLGRWRGEAVV